MRKIGFQLFIMMNFIFNYGLFAQMQGLHGDFTEWKKGEHAGNMFRTTFYNDGTFGAYDMRNTGDIGGEWPKNSGHYYLLDGDVFVGSQVIDNNGMTQYIFSEVIGYGGTTSRGDQDPNTNEWWTFLPLPGFNNPAGDRVAMSKWPDSWPPRWPDIGDPANPVYSDDGWAGSWNGYFGRDIENADEESYFVADDYANKEFNFTPDSRDPLDYNTKTGRGGLGIRMYVRGFQWSNVLVQDGIFLLFDLENIGTYHHDKVVFGYKIGNNMGDTPNNWDENDDMGAYDIERDIAYLWDYDNIGASDWGTGPVGYFGGSFLESPGNSHDGIDNDNDGIAGSGGVIDGTLWADNVLTVNENVIKIDYETFEREVVSVPAEGIVIEHPKGNLTFMPGDTLREIPRNLIDDNLNGIIDENNGVDLGGGIITYLNTGFKYINYFTGVGADNPLIDERRDDGIDNDGDWNPLWDDLGRNGKQDTLNPDIGEGDGIPTPGEPHFDKTDIDESDMLGLTSFVLYSWRDMPHFEDSLVWRNLQPGRFDDLMENDNIELLYGSGYFPMLPGDKERFSIALACGVDLNDFEDNMYYFAKAYHGNYNFPKAPLIPVVSAVAGDNRVTLYWDNKAESFRDPISGLDFEGYRIYRSKSPMFGEIFTTMDGQSYITQPVPIAQFDLVNEYQGYSGADVKGIKFWLGENTGLQHCWTDTTVQNGYEYYYAVTSYDHGEYNPLVPENQIPATECTIHITVNASGEIEEKGNNVVRVRPEAYSAGYVPASLDSVRLLTGGTATGTISYNIIDPEKIRDNHSFRITFEDTIIRFFPQTTTLSLIDVSASDTLVDRASYSRKDVLLNLTEKIGLEISLINDSVLTVDRELSGWNSDGVIYNYEFRRNTIGGGIAKPSDYRIVFGEIGLDTSEADPPTYPSVPVNFRITNLTEGKDIKFFFSERDTADGMFNLRGSRSDEVIFYETAWDGEESKESRTWKVVLASGTGLRNPQAGDTLTLILEKPFLSHDVYEFVTYKPKIDLQLAKNDLDRIRVVPNPYVATNSWEPINPYGTGRGERHLHFIHLPATCTIKIFTVSGQLVKTIEHRHESQLQNGTEIWNMLSKDNLEIAYGLYIYYIKAPGIGEKIGKFAVIK